MTAELPGRSNRGDHPRVVCTVKQQQSRHDGALMHGDVDRQAHERRRRWFDMGVQAITAVVPDAPQLYVCPCCLAPFGRDAIADGRLTVEHVPPESLGGRPLVLTCEVCNSTAGHRLDADAERAEAHLDFMCGTSSRPLRGTVRAAGTALVGEVQATPDGILLLGVPKANHPNRPREVIDAIDGLLATDTTGLTIGFTSGERWNQRSALMSWVRAAYLVGFALLGYSYICRPEFEQLRAALADSSTRLAPLPVATEPAQPRERREAFVITGPAWLHSLVIRIGRHTVFLPATFPDPEFFARVATDLASGRQGLGEQWEVVQFGWPSQPEFRMDSK